MRKDLKPVDLCYQHAQTISIANAIAARYDAGICRHKFEHPGVCEIINLGERVDMTSGRNKIFSKQASKQVEIIGCMDNTLDSTFESANRVYDTDGLCPTIPTCGGGGIQPKIMEIQKMEQCMIVGVVGSTQKNAYVGNGDVCPSLTGAMGMGGGQTPMVCEKTIVAMRGRNPENPSDRTAGIELEQRLEPNTEGICNNLTTVQKDNLVLEKKTIKIRQATKDGFIECEIGGGRRPGLSVIPHTQRASNRERKDMPNVDNGDYP